VVGCHVATPDVNINLYNTDEAASMQQFCSSLPTGRQATRTTCYTSWHLCGYNDVLITVSCVMRELAWLRDAKEAHFFFFFFLFFFFFFFFRTLLHVQRYYESNTN